LVARAGGDPRDARAALKDLCASYWYPLYAFARRRGLAHHAAQDLVQAFFARPWRSAI
jgi:RNA polymerase sigma-70 factor (ECF subfamily)